MARCNVVPGPAQTMHLIQTACSKSSESSILHIHDLALVLPIRVMSTAGYYRIGLKFRNIVHHNDMHFMTKKSLAYIWWELVIEIM